MYLGCITRTWSKDFLIPKSKTNLFQFMDGVRDSNSSIVIGLLKFLISRLWTLSNLGSASLVSKSRTKIAALSASVAL